MSTEMAREGSESPSRRDALKLASAVALGGATLALAQTAEAATPQVAAGEAGGQTRFALEIDGVRLPGVTAVEQMESMSDPVPGATSRTTLAITRDFNLADSAFISWRLAAQQGKVDRKSISVVIFNDAGVEAGRLNFYQAWPIKWQGPALNARESGHASEKIEVTWETMELKAG